MVLFGTFFIHFLYLYGHYTLYFCPCQSFF
nr:MAG TPA: Colipase [Caudoviricetes sp.]